MKWIPQHSCLRGGVMAAALAAAGVASVQAQTYTIVDLGTLGDGSEGEGISATGLVAGWGVRDDGAKAEFVHDGQGIRELPLPPGSTRGYAYDLNDLGHAVGVADVGFLEHAHLWRDGERIDLGFLGTRRTVAHGINNLGHIVGHTVGGPPNAWIWRDGVMTALPNIGHTTSEAWDITESGIIAGMCSDIASERAVLWQNGEVLRVLDMPIGADDARALGANERGEAVGSYSTLLYTHPVYWDVQGRAHPLPLLNGSSEALAINSQGVIVGAVIPGGHGVAGFTAKALLWRDGGVFHLEDLVVNASGWDLYRALDVNDAGQIVGTGTFNGDYHAFRLDPNPAGFTLSTPIPGTSGHYNLFNVNGATPGATVHVVYSRSTGSARVPGCPDLRVNLANPAIVGTEVADEFGFAAIGASVPDLPNPTAHYLQAVERSTCRTTDVVEYTF